MSALHHARMASTEDRLRTLVDDHLDIGRDVDFDAGLGEAGVSSVDRVAFMKVVTEEFNLTIPSEDYPKIQNLRDLAGYIDGRAG